MLICLRISKCKEQAEEGVRMLRKMIKEINQELEKSLWIRLFPVVLIWIGVIVVISFPFNSSLKVDVIKGFYFFLAVFLVFFISELRVPGFILGWLLLMGGLLADFLGDIKTELEAVSRYGELTLLSAGLIVLAIRIRLTIVKLRRSEERAQSLLRRDPLTGVYNRYVLDEILNQEVKRARRYGHKIGIIIIDIDNFKKINDKFGHLMGDKTLKMVADFLKKNVRETDFVVRYGGDEFLIIQLEITSESDVAATIERIKKKLKELNESSLEFPLVLSLSLGGVCWNPREKSDIEEVFNIADKRLYKEKRQKNIYQRPQRLSKIYYVKKSLQI